MWTRYEVRVLKKWVKYLEAEEVAVAPAGEME